MRTVTPGPAAGSARFHAYIDDAMLEIGKRDDAYLSRFPVPLPEPRAFAEKAWAGLRHCRLSRSSIEQILREGTAYLAAKHRTTRGSGVFVADWVGAAMIDSHQAASREIALEIVPEREGKVSDALGTAFDFRSSARGGYYIRKEGVHPLVLVNATGLPIETWRRLLCDGTHNYKLLVPCRPHGDLFAGGIRNHVSLEDEAAEIVCALDHEGLAPAHVLGWCNGARLAVEVTARLASRAASLTLLAPMFDGMPGMAPMLTPYLRDLRLILQLVAKEPASAARFAGKLSEMVQPIDWNTVAGDDGPRLEEIFRLPNRRHVRELLIPMLSADSLVNVARRVASDASHPTLTRLSALRVPVMVVLGSHDGIVSNQATLATLHKACCKSANLVLLGGGHDLHDLQYAYVRYLLGHFFELRRLPVPSARVRLLT